MASELDPNCSRYSFHIATRGGEQSLAATPDYVLVDPLDRRPGQAVTRADSPCEIALSYGPLADQAASGIQAFTPHRQQCPRAARAFRRRHLDPWT